MTANAFNIGALIATMGLDSTQFQAGMASVQTSIAATDAATKKASISMAASMAAAGARMEAIGKKMTKFISLPLLAIGALSFKAQKDFEASMSKIEGLVGVAREEVERLSEATLALSPAVGRGPEELADALFFIESAGLRGARAMEVLNMSARASVSGLGETKVIADLVTSAMNAYGAANLNAAQATDTLVATVKEGKAEAPELAAAMGMVLPIASEMGVSFDQVGAAFAGMTRTGTKARVAATQLKAIMASLLKPTQQAEDALVSMGLSSSGLRAQIKEKGLIDTLETLRLTTNKYGEDTMAKVFPNIRALMGVLDLMGANMAENIAISERMVDSTGALDAAFDAASNTTQFKWDKAIAQVKTTIVKFGTVMKSTVVPLIEGFTKKVKGLTDRLDAMTESEKQTTIKIIAITAAMGPLLTITGKLFKLIAANPYVAAITAIAVIIVSIVQWTKANRELFDGLSGIENANRKLEKQYAEQSSQIRMLVGQIENENLSNGFRIAAIEKLKKIMPDYNGQLSEEGVLIGHNTEAIDTYLTALKEKIRLQAYEEEYTRLLKRQFELQNKIGEATLKSVGVGPGAIVAAANLLRLNKQYDKNIEAIEEMETAAGKLSITLGAIPEPPPVVPPVSGGGPGGGPGDGPNVVLERTASAAVEAANGLAYMNDELAISQDQLDFSKIDFTPVSNGLITVGDLFESMTAKAMVLGSAITGIGSAIGNLIAGQEGALKSFFTATLQGISSIMTALLAQAIGGMIAGEAVKGLPGLIAAGIGIAGILTLWEAKVPEFASGALAYGPVIGKMGEYPGASTNPEVIAPLSDLRNILGRDNTGLPKVITLVARGRDMVATIDAEMLNQNTY